MNYTRIESYYRSNKWDVVQIGFRKKEVNVKLSRWSSRRAQRLRFKKHVVLSLIVGLAVASIIVFASYSMLSSSPEKLQVADVLKVDIYSSPGCECCKRYARYLIDQGFKVNLVFTEKMDAFKNDLEIPSDVWSCHTSKIGQYYVEGHVPVEAVRKLLAEKPGVDGIALPGMPPGSPGMEGVKTKPFIIYSIQDGVKSKFLEV